MTDNPAVISGQLVDVRNIATDKSIRLSIHVPAELAAAVIDSFGWPTNVSPVPVAIARLVEGGDAAEGRSNVPKISTPDTRPRAASEQPRGAKKSPAQMAGILCADPKFQAFLGEFIHEMDGPIGRKMDIDEAFAAKAVRDLCRVKSRSEIIEGTTAADYWRGLVEHYRAWEAAPRAGA